MEKQKDLNADYGQIFTPDFIVEEMLDEVGYDNPSILGKHIIDPSCGDGQILKGIVKRIIKFAEPEKLEYYLSFVHGWEIDTRIYNICRKNLLELTECAKSVNLKNIDSLTMKPNPLLKTGCEPIFDFVVGNPPYINSADLDEGVKTFIKTNYSFINGSFDIYHAFFELIGSIITDDGVCAFITPLWYKNRTSKQMMEHFKQYKNIRFLHTRNYAVFVNEFSSVRLPSVITIFHKAGKKSFDTIRHIEDNYNNTERKEYQQTIEELSKSINLENTKDVKTFGDICELKTQSFTTPDQHYFLIRKQDIKKINQNYVTFYNYWLKRDITIEKGVLLPVIKSSRLPFVENKNPSENIKNSEVNLFCIYPYKSNQLYNEESFKKLYPLTYNYLNSYKANFKNKTIPFYKFPILPAPIKGDTIHFKKIALSYKSYAFYVNSNLPVLSCLYGVLTDKDYNIQEVVKYLNSKYVGDFLEAHCKKESPNKGDDSNHLTLSVNVLSGIPMDKYPIK